MSNTTRNRIADELMSGCPDESRTAHQMIADAIRSGISVDEVLAMCDDWPDTYVWLKNEFAAH